VRSAAEPLIRWSLLQIGAERSKKMYIDFHVHTNRSDGVYAPEEVVQKAKACGIGVLAITDHNSTADLTELRRCNPDISLVQGAEMSCIYTAPDHAQHEVHVVALHFDRNNAKMQEALRLNQPDRRPYVEAILKRLADCGIHIGSYDQLVNENPESSHVGRVLIAKKMAELGYVPTPDAAFEEYIGAFGKRRAYVQSPLQYISMEDCINAILSANGVPVLAHLFYYQMSDADQRTLVQTFQRLTRGSGGMETSYSLYSAEQRQYLRSIADEYGLLHSAGSDFHGKDDAETLDCRFPASEFQPLLARVTSPGNVT
jgi:predicted metal-dependent phosphoesterase TrpH